MHRFIPAYLDELATQFADSVSHERFTRVAQRAVHALIQSGDAERTNRERYLAMLEIHLEIPAARFEERLHNWLEDGLPRLAGHVFPVEGARPLLDHCFSLDIPVVLATNPVFPAPLIEARLTWAGLADYPFHLVTSYENTRFCKPQAGYFMDLLEGLRIEASSTLMIGNDTEHDLAAGRVGIATFLADTYLIDRLGGDYHSDWRGGLDDLHRLLR